MRANRLVVLAAVWIMEYVINSSDVINVYNLRIQIAAFT